MALPWKDGGYASGPRTRPTGNRPRPGQRAAEYRGDYAAIRDAMAAGLWSPPGTPGPMAPPAPTDPRNVIGTNGGGSRRRGGGGGGGGGAVDNTAAMSSAYQAALNWMKGQNGDFLRDPALIAAMGDTSGLEARVGRYEQSARDAHSAATTAVNNAANAGNQRLDQIVQMLGQRLGGARQDVQGVFRGNAADLAAQAATAQNRAGAVAQGVNRSAAGFGFEPAGDVQGVGDLAQALQAAASQKASAYDAAYADRQNVYGGLQADVSRSILDRQQAMANQSTQMLQRLLGDAAVRRTEGLGQISQQRLAEQARQSQAAAQWAQQNQGNIYQMMIEAAQQGITL